MFTTLSWAWIEILHEGELSTMHNNEKTFFHDDSYLISKTLKGSDFCGFKKSLNLEFGFHMLYNDPDPEKKKKIVVQYTKIRL